MIIYDGESSAEEYERRSKEVAEWAACFALMAKNAIKPGNEGNLSVMDAMLAMSTASIILMELLGVSDAELAHCSLAELHDYVERHYPLSSASAPATGDGHTTT